ncbi:MAG: hypothetical protein ACFFCW_01825 [Candidatus Hodarchaeota archaeon]
MPFENKISEGDITYEEDKLKFFLSAYREAHQHNQNYKEKVLENRAFWDGNDEVLRKRESDPNIARSAHFVSEARPAIDTRININCDRLSENMAPVILSTRREYQDDEKTNDINQRKTLEINEYLRESGFLVEKLRDHFLGAEIQPVSWVKISKETITRDEPKEKRIPVTEDSLLAHVLKYGKMPPGLTVETDGTLSIKQVVWEEEIAYDGPMVQWCDWDEILYDPTSPCFGGMRYIIHRRWMTWNELVKFTKEINGNMKKLENVKSEVDATDEKTEERIATQVEAESAKTDIKKVVDPLISGKKKNKYLLCEFWFKHYNEKENRQEIRTMYVARNREVLKDRLSAHRGFDFPFYPKVAHRRLGQFEGDSSIDLIKDIQRIFNDLYNALLDFLSYGALSETWLSDTITFKDQPKRGPGAMVYYSGDPTGIIFNKADVTVIHHIIGLIEMAAAKIRHILNAPDISQGLLDSATEEKATKTRLRQQGHLRRFRTVFLDTENDIRRITRIFMLMLVNDDPEWIVPLKTAEIIVPTLSGTNTPEEEQLFAAELYKMAESSIIFQGPVGMPYLLELFRDVLEKSRVKNINDRIPKKEELLAQDKVLQLIQAMMPEEGEQNVA